MLIDLAATAKVFHTPTGIAYADLTMDGHRETWPVRGPRLRAWLRRRYYEATRNVPTAPALSAALNLLEAQAQFDGPERTVHVRVAEHAGYIYLDLADITWRAIEIGPHGWRVLEEPPVRFRRPAGLQEAIGSVNPGDCVANQSFARYESETFDGAKNCTIGFSIRSFTRFPW